jgi:hypothetical protein
VGRWGYSKDRLGEGVQDRDDLGGSERTEGASVPEGLERTFARGGEDRRSDLTS